MDAQTIIAKRIARELHSGMLVDLESAFQRLWRIMYRKM